MGGGLGSRARVAPLGALAALIAVAGVGVLVTQPSTAASPAVLQVAERSVEVQAKGSAGFSAARSGDSITEGALIRTDRTGVAAIAYEDGSLTRLGPATSYELVTLRTQEGRREIIGELDTGQTFHRVSKVTGSSSRFEVHTSDAVAAVRGTEFAVQCIVLDICEFGVTEGIVSVRAADGREVDVTAGHRVTVDGDGRLGELKRLSGTDPWLARNTSGTEPLGSTRDPDPGDETAPTTASAEPAGTSRFRSWGRFPPGMSGSDPQSAAADSADDDSTASNEDRDRRERSGTPTTASAGSTDRSETTSTSAEPTTTITEAATTTTAGSADRRTSTTSTTRDGDDRTTTTTSAGRDRTTTTTAGGDGTTTTSTTSDGGDSTTTTTSGGSDGTTTTTGGTSTTATSAPTTTTTGRCPEGEEHVEGRGCMPECPHDRPRDPNGNCRRQCTPGDQGEACRSAASAGSGRTESNALPFLWIFSFLFGGTVLVRRPADGWEN